MLRSSIINNSKPSQLPLQMHFETGIDPQKQHLYMDTQLSSLWSTSCHRHKKSRENKKISPVSVLQVKVHKWLRASLPSAYRCFWSRLRASEPSLHTEDIKGYAWGHVILCAFGIQQFKIHRKILRKCITKSHKFCTNKGQKWIPDHQVYSASII